MLASLNKACSIKVMKKFKSYLLGAFALLPLGYLAYTNLAPPAAINQVKAEGKYADYTPELQAQLHGIQPYALFFYAPWCPSCRIFDTQLQASFNKLPANTKLLRIDFDTTPELRQQYNVTSQHTTVFLNAEGQAVAVIPGTSVEDVTSFFANQSAPQ